MIIKLVCCLTVILLSFLPFSEANHESHPRNFAQTCSELSQSSRSCFTEFNGEMQGYCEVCREDKSCFMASLNREERSACEAYKEEKSCFMSFNGTDRGWCEHIKEGKSCFMALNGRERELCEQGRIPRKHRVWAYFWSY